MTSSRPSVIRPALLTLVLTLAACPDDKRQIGDSCAVDDQCASGLCFGRCLEPNGDADGDGIANVVEIFFGTEPLQTDSDGDGKSDTEEYGAATTIDSTPSNVDGDDLIDAAESSLFSTGDGDCIPNELDPEDAVDDTSPEHVSAHCGFPLSGPCAAAPAEVVLNCTAEGPRCDYSGVTGFGPDDTCDGVDDNCDGVTDEDCASCGANSPHDPSAVVYVSAAGTAPGSGTATDPYTSFAAGIANAAGRRVLVAKGTYTEDITVPTGTVVVEGGWEPCHFDSQDLELPATVITGTGNGPVVRLPVSSVLDASFITIRATGSSTATAVSVQGGDFTCGNCLIDATSSSEQLGVELQSGAATLVNSVITLDGGTSATRAITSAGAGQLTVAHSLLRPGGAAGITVGIDVSSGAGDVRVLNSLLDLRATGPDVIGVNLADGLAWPVLAGNDFSLAGSASPAVRAGNPLTLAEVNAQGPDAWNNYQLGCAPLAAPWSLVPACKDLGVDPTLVVPELGHPGLAVDRGGEAREDGSPDIGTDEARGAGCADLADCNDGDTCTVDACVLGTCVYPVVEADLDGDGLCDSQDEDADGDGAADASLVGGTDCDDTDPTVQPGACDGYADDASCTTSAPPANTLYVDDDADPAVADGSPSRPFTTIGAALTAAPDNGTILVAGGTYVEALQLDRDVTLRGGFEACDFQPFSAPVEPTVVQAPDGSAATAHVAAGVTVTLEWLRLDLVSPAATASVVEVGVAASIALRHVRLDGQTTGTPELIGVNAPLAASVTVEDSTLSLDGAQTQVGVSYSGSDVVRVVRTALLLSNADEATGIDAEGQLWVISAVIDASGVSTATGVRFTTGSLAHVVNSALVVNAQTDAYGLDLATSAGGSYHLLNTIVDVGPASLSSYGVSLDTGQGGSLNTAANAFGLDVAGHSTGFTVSASSLVAACPFVEGIPTYNLGGPCLDAGIDPTAQVGPESDLLLDFQGNTRPQDGTWDIGPSQNIGICEDNDQDGICNNVDPDDDNDGVVDGDDCAPFDETVAPGAAEVCGDGVINDCNAQIPTGTVVYIAPDGDDTTGLGTASQPWATLGQARLAVESSGGTIIAAEGTITDNVGGGVFVAGGDVVIKGGRRPGCEWGLGSGRTQFLLSGGLSVSGGSVDVQDALLVSPSDDPAAFVSNATLTIRDGAAVVKTNGFAGIVVSGAAVLTLDNVRVAAPDGASANAGLLIGGDSVVNITGGRFSGNQVPTSSAIQLNSGGSPDVTVDGAIFVTDAGGAAARVQSGHLKLVDSVVIATGDAGPVIGVSVDGGILTAVHSFIAAYGSEGAPSIANGIRFASPDGPHWVANSIIHAEAGTAANDAYGIFGAIAGGTVEARNNAIFAYRVDQPGIAVGGQGTLNEVGTIDAKCDLSASVRLDNAVGCIDAAADMAVLLGGGLPDLSALWASDFGGEPRGAAGTWDVGPDEILTCTDVADCAVDGDPCTTGAVCGTGGRCEYPFAVDGDFDGVCDGGDQACPASQVGGTGDFDLDGDGCLDIVDCNDADPTINPGASEVCGDGVDNDCNGGGIVPGAVYVHIDAPDPGDGQPDTPFQTLTEALTAVQGQAEATIFVSTGDLPAEALDLTSTLQPDNFLVEGGLDPGCDWDPVGYTRVPSPASVGAAVSGPTGSETTLRRFEIEVTDGSHFQIAGVRLAGDGVRTLDQCLVKTASSIAVADSLNLGVELVGGSVSAVLNKTAVEVGSSANATGVGGLFPIPYTLQGSSITVDGAPGGTATGAVFFAATGVDKVIGSVIEITGNPDSATGLTKGSTTPFEVTNSVITVSGATATGILLNNGAGMAAVGNTIGANASSGLARGVLVNVDTATVPDVQLVNNELTAQGAGGGIALSIIDAGPGASIQLAHNAIVAEALLSGPAFLQKIDDLNSCTWAGCVAGPGTNQNFDLPCYLTADYHVNDTSPCAAGGIDPTLLGLSNEGMFEDRDGDPRPGGDEIWSVGPDEEDRTCLDADNDGVCQPADCNDRDPDVFPGNPNANACDGKDNACVDGGAWETDLAGGFFVQLGATGTGIPGNPFGSVQEALDAIATQNLTEADIYIATGTASDTQVVVNDTTHPFLARLGIHGARDSSDCEWRAQLGSHTILIDAITTPTDSPQVEFNRSSAPLDVSMSRLELRIEGGTMAIKSGIFFVADGRFDGSDLRIVTEDASAETFAFRIDKGEAFIYRSVFHPGAAPITRGVHADKEGRIELYDSLVEPLSTSGLEFGNFTNLIELDNPNVGADHIHVVANSVVKLGGGAKGDLIGVRVGDQAELLMVNSVVDIQPDPQGGSLSSVTALDVKAAGAFTQRAQVFNSALMVPNTATGGRVGAFISDSGEMNRLQNTIVHAPGALGLLVSQDTTQLELFNNHVTAQTFAEHASQSVSLAEVESCGYDILECLVASNNLTDADANCMLTATDYSLDLNQSCADLGLDDLSTVPQVYQHLLQSDRQGAARCSQDGSEPPMLDVGPYEVPCP